LGTDLNDQTPAGGVVGRTDLRDDKFAAVLSLVVLVQHRVLDDEFADGGGQPPDIERPVTAVDGTNGQLAQDLDHGETPGAADAPMPARPCNGNSPSTPGGVEGMVSTSGVERVRFLTK